MRDTRILVPVCGALAGLAIATGLLLLSAAPASALSKNVFSTSFAGSGTNTLSNPQSIAIDQRSNDVYVSDPADYRIEKFSAAGEFILMFGSEVNATTHADVCTATETCQVGKPGSTPGTFSSAAELWLAIDDSPGAKEGDVYVGDAGDGIVSKFDPTGNLISSWGEAGQLDGSSATFGPFSVAGSPLQGVAVEANGDLLVEGNNSHLFRFSSGATFLSYSPTGVGNSDARGFAVDASEDIFISSHEGLTKLRTATSGSPSKIQFVGGYRIAGQETHVVGSAIDPATRDAFITRQEGSVAHYAASCQPSPEECTPIDTFGTGHLNGPLGLAIDDSTGDVYVADSDNHRVAVFTAVPYLPNATNLSAKSLTPTSESISGKIDPAGAGPVTACHFEYGETTTYGSGPLPCSVPTPIESPTEVSTAANLEGLTYATAYRFHLVAENANGENASYYETFTTLPNPPAIGATSISEVHADAALVNSQINPGGAASSYQVEYVTQEQFEAAEFHGASQSPSLEAESARKAEPVSAHLSGLSPGTTYHYRVIATNADNPTEPSQGPVHTFTTLPFIPPINDPCPNAHVRQQTGAAQLLDCRAYELVSAANSDGYDVESNLIAGQSPYPGYPEADGKVLYAVHDGGVPGTNHPTNRGPDPYVATRGPEGWSTEYVGVPANNPFSAAPFTSIPSGADAKLETFAFGGSEGCSPCFEGGYTGIPVRTPNDELTQGMASSKGFTEPGAAAKPDGYIAKPLSANGEHFIFGSTSAFAPGGNDETADVSIYDRNLTTGETHVVSDDPQGEPLPCLAGVGKCHSPGDTNGISELDISADGSHILLGQKVSEDADGNVYYHLYMDVGDGVRSIDLTPGATDGVLYDGMSADGSKVFFTTKDALHTAANQDTDESADLYLAEVSGEGSTLTRISTGSEGSGNTDSCDPVADSAHPHWNTVNAAEENCGVVAIGGGGGVASASGAIYFLSPEKLDGSANGIQNAPNLYLASPSNGYTPHYVTTLESALNSPHPPKLQRNFKQDFGSFKGANGLAVDHQSGDVYVLSSPNETEQGEGVTPSVEKFDSSGHLITSFGDATPSPDGKLTGTETPAGSFSNYAELGVPTQLAVDNDPTSPSYRDLYVPNFNGVIDKFGPSGNYISQISAPLATSVAVNQANGDVYVTQLIDFSTFTPHLRIFSPEGAPVSNFAVASEPNAVAVDPASGDVYVSSLAEEKVVAYEESGKELRTLDSHSAHGLAVDPSNGDVYVDEGPQIAHYDSSGDRLANLGAANLSGSLAVAIDPEGNLYATTESTSTPGSSEVAVFAASLAPDTLIDNPMVLDSVTSAATRHSADFQTTPSGEFAAFPSTLALAGAEEETAGHTVLYRYDAGSGKLDCISCTTTGSPSAGDSSLASAGLSLTNDGRVFFNSGDQLVSADTDKKQDVYEWAQPGAGNCGTESTAYDKAAGDCLALVSAGTSPFDSGLLSASANGTDAFFFTRDSLAPQDKNGDTMKIYDAREGGGFPYIDPRLQCQASDECHGASSPAPGPVQVGSVGNTPGNTPEEPKCRKGSVKRHGRCVRLHHHKRPKHHHRGAHR